MVQQQQQVRVPKPFITDLIIGRETVGKKEGVSKYGDGNVAAQALKSAKFQVFFRFT
jgi:hypothetical protein